MITETKTERGRTVLKVETEEEMKQAFGRMLEDESIDIDAPPELGVRVAMERKPGVFGDHAVSVRDGSSGVDASHALPGRARR